MTLLEDFFVALRFPFRATLIYVYFRTGLSAAGHCEEGGGQSSRAMLLHSASVPPLDHLVRVASPGSV